MTEIKKGVFNAFGLSGYCVGAARLPDSCPTCDETLEWREHGFWNDRARCINCAGVEEKPIREVCPCCERPI